MSKTPSKSTQACNFSPKEITSPNKDTPGISKTVFSHISNLHSLLQDWIRVQDKGTKICKTISALKLHECYDNYYPQQLKSLMESLNDALDSFKHFVEGVEMIQSQLQAVAKLQPTDQPVIFTWSAGQIFENVQQIYASLEKEFELKQVIIENIAHCRNENLIEVYVSAWEFEVYLDLNTSAYLFAEVGLTHIT